MRDVTPGQLVSMPRTELDDFIAEVKDLAERYESAVREAALSRDLCERAERYAAERRQALIDNERRAEKAERDRDRYMAALIEAEKNIAAWLERTVTLDSRYRRAAEDIRSGAWRSETAA